MRSALILLLGLLLWTGEATAASTINPTVPTANSPLASAPVRNNFLAAYGDVNNILGMYAGSTAPANPVQMQRWADTSGSPTYTLRVWNSTTATWVAYATLNISTGVYTTLAVSGGFVATAPLTVGVSGGVVTYGLTADSNFAVSAGALALAPIASGDLIANCTGSSAEPTLCTWSAFADRAIGSTNGFLPYRTGGAWSTISTGTSGATVPLNSTANTFSAAQSIITNLTSIPTPDTGALLSLANVDGTGTRVELTSAGATPVVSGRAALGTLSSPLTLTNGSLMMSFNAHGYDGTSWATTASGALHIYAEGTWSNTSHPTETCDATTPASSTTVVDVLCVHANGGVTLGTGPTSQGAGTLNLLNGLYNSGTGPTGSGGGYVLATGPTIASPTFTGTVAGAGTIPNSVLVNSSVTLGSTSVALGATVTTFAGMTLTTPTINGAALSGTFSGTPTLSGANFVTLANIVQDTTAWSLLGNATSGTADYAPFTITGLTAKTTPVGADQLMIADSAASGALKVSTLTQIIGSLASGVTSLGGGTGVMTVTGPLQVVGTSGGALSINATTTAHALAVWQGTSAMTAVAPAVAGNYVGGAGASADPQFNSGPWTLLATLTATGSATTLGDTTHVTSTYNEYEFVFTNLVPATNANTCEIQVHSGGSFQATSYLAAGYAPNGTAIISDVTTTFIPCGHTTSQANSGAGISGFLRVSTPSASALHVFYGVFSYNGASAYQPFTVSGLWNSSAAIDGLQLTFGTGGNINSGGTIKIYGRL